MAKGEGRAYLLRELIFPVAVALHLMEECAPNMKGLSDSNRLNFNLLPLLQR